MERPKGDGSGQTPNRRRPTFDLIEITRAQDYVPTYGTRMGAVMAFIQIIELRTTKVSEIEELIKIWKAASEGRRSAQRATVTQDLDRPNTYLQIVEFPSHESAMANSELTETTLFAARLAELCDGPIEFRNLEVVRVVQM